jgi:AAA family ATP:ADP antiporter
VETQLEMLKALFGDVPYKELPRILFHAVVLSLIICGFWLLDSLKDPILSTTVGMQNQPLAKGLSVLMTVIVVSVFDFLTSMLSKPDLFLCISGFYGLFFFVISALLADPAIGLSHGYDQPYRSLGFISYVAVETYGSLMVALFWAFTNSMVDLELAKGAYGFIICFAQLGAIVGSTLATQTATIGIPTLYLIASMTVFSVGLSIKLYFIVFKGRNVEGRHTRVRSSTEDSEGIEYIASAIPLTTFSKQTSEDVVTPAPPTHSVYNICNGFYEGLLLIIQYRYTWYLLGVSTLYEIVLTVLDYEFKLSGAQYSKQSVAAVTATAVSDTIEVLSVAASAVATPASSTSAEAQDKFAQLLGHFGQATNMLALLLSIFGFSTAVRSLGVRSTLMIFPFLLFIGMLILILYVILSYDVFSNFLKILPIF